MAKEKESQSVLFKRRSGSEKIFDVFNVLFLFLFSVTILFPFIQQINISISDAIAVKRISLFVLPPFGETTFDNYRKIFATGALGKAYLNTTYRIVLGTMLTLFVTSTYAYALSRKYMPFRGFFTKILVFTMFFSGGLIPSYLLITQTLKWTNTIWALVVPGMMSAFNVVIVRNFMMSLPEELNDSAKIDGATEITVLTRIILPLSMPIIATLSLWTMVGHWNAWFDVILYINKGDTDYLQILLRRVMWEANRDAGEGIMAEIRKAQNVANQTVTPDGIKAAILISTTLPILCVYPFLQKYFVKGIMIGSLKG